MWCSRGIDDLSTSQAERHLAPLPQLFELAYIRL